MAVISINVQRFSRAKFKISIFVSGKKVNWAPWNCMRVIMESVGPGENHGCPYKHNDPENLRQLLVQSGLEGDGLNQVMNLSKEGHFQKACALQFKYSHKGMLHYSTMLKITSGSVRHYKIYNLQFTTYLLCYYRTRIIYAHD